MTPCGSIVCTNPNIETISPSGMFLTRVSIFHVTTPFIIIFLVCIKSVLICQGGFSEHFILEIVLQYTLYNNVNIV